MSEKLKFDVKNQSENSTKLSKFSRASLAPEQYELNAAPSYRFELKRRDFFKILGGGIAVVFATPNLLAQQQSRSRNAMPDNLSAWLHIGEDGAVTIYTGKVEVGQNIRTSLAQVVAEELQTPMDAIKMVMGDTDLTPFDRGTFGSRSTPIMGPQLRKVAAAARELLIDLAAEAWKIDRSSLVASDGKITNPKTGKSFGYGELSKGQKLVKTINDNEPLTPPEKWKIAGTSVAKVDGRAFVTGKHRYSSDMKLPDMLYGKVLRPSAFGATLISVDTREAEAMLGVTVVRDSDFVGVAAPNEFIAGKALARIKAEWKVEPQLSRKELFNHLKNHPVEEQGWRRREPHTTGSIADGMAAADKKLSQTYTVDYIAHTPLEPRAAVAQWVDGKLTVWTGTQRPFGVLGELTEAFRLAEDRVRVIVPDTGSGYGGKHTGECAIEAARLAKAAGKPVKLIWSREEEFTWAYFRPAGVIEVSSGVRSDGKITAWEFHNYNSGSSAIETKYDIPNQHIEFHATDSPLRQGSYRGLAATANHFARESHLDELAHAVKIDPLEFRLKNLSDARLRAVFEAAAKKFGWGKTKTDRNHGFGIAGGYEKGGYVATCAEVAADSENGKVHVVRVVLAFECGAIINPDHLKNQVEGSAVMGLGGALFEAIDFANGKILNPHFSSYRVPRFNDIPKFETVLLDRKDLPSAGAGETPIVGIAPAISNAIFAATGIRLHTLPLVPNGLET